MGLPLRHSRASGPAGALSLRVLADVMAAWPARSGADDNVDAGPARQCRRSELLGAAPWAMAPLPCVCPPTAHTRVLPLLNESGRQLRPGAGCRHATRHAMSIERRWRRGHCALLARPLA